MSQSEEREKNISRVIETALELFLSDGIAETSINRIAKACGLAPMSIYRYFGSRDALKSRVEEVQNTLKKVSDAKTQVIGFVEQVKKVVTSIKSFFEKIGDIIGL